MQGFFLFILRARYWAKLWAKLWARYWARLWAKLSAKLWAGSWARFLSPWTDWTYHYSPFKPRYFLGVSYPIATR